MAYRYTELWVKNNDDSWNCAGRLNGKAKHILTNVFKVGRASMLLIHFEIDPHKDGESGRAEAHWKNFDGTDEEKERILRTLFA